MASPAFSLTTLGELRLVGPSGPMLSGRRKELVLLAFIARRSPKPVSRDELLALLWGERDEDKARQSLRHALHQLRRALGDAIDTTAEQVRIGDGMVDVDATLLEREIASGRLVDAADRWNGDFLLGAEDVGGEEYTAWLERERESLRRSAIVAFGRLVALGRANNDIDEEIRWSRRWAELFPLDETAHLRLVESLRRHGNVDEARALHATFVTRLKSDLDLPPSVELMRLGEELSRSTRPERERRPGTGAIVAPDLVGRGAAVVLSLHELWSQVRTEGAVAIIEGKQGTGKSRLCSELTRRIRGGGEPTIVLEARPTSDAPAPWSTLRCLMNGVVHGAAIEDAPNKALVELSDLLPDLRARFPHLAPPSGNIDRQETALRDVLRVIGAKSPLLMIVDDYASADAETHALLRRLIAAPPRGAMIVLTLDPEHPAGAVRSSELGELASVRRFKLAPLAQAEVGAMLDSMLEIAPADKAALTERLFRESDGNPHRITALVSKLTGSGELVLDGRGVWQLRRITPESVVSGQAAPVAAPSAVPARRDGRRRWLIAGVAATVLVAAGFSVMKAVSSSSKPLADSSVAPRVAVLDLELAGGDTTDAYLASGLAEEINSTLSRFEDLRIKSRGSVRTMRAAGVIDAVKLGQALQVDYLVEGSLRHVGSLLKVAVRLTKASDGFQLWSKDFDAPVNTLPALHEQIAREVASRIGSRLTHGELAFPRKLPTSDAQAYEYYLRGNYYLSRRTPPTVEQAIAQYRMAVARDSSFAAARARIAYSYALLVDWGWPYAGKPPEQLVREGLQLVEEAVRIDSSAADTWMASAYLLEAADPVHMSGAAEAFEHAIALDPKNSEAIHQYAQLHEALGNWDKAVPAFRRTLLLEPDRSLPYVAMASIAWKKGSPSEARRLYDSALVLDPGASYALSARALLRVHQGDVKGGLQDAETAVHVEDGYSIPPHSVLAIALAKSGSMARARLEVDRALSEVPDPSAPSPTDARFIASALIAVGRNEQALDVLERARPRGAWLWFYALAPDFDPVKNDPRFIRVMQEAHPPAGSSPKS